MTEPDWSSLAEPVARHFWGEPNKALSHKLELRWGGGGSRKLNIGGESNGFWHDFESGEGGGVIDLVMRETDTDKAGALEWLASNGFIDPKEPRDDVQPRQDGRSAPPATGSPPTEERQPELAVETPQGTPVNVKGYRYTDGDGNVLYEVIRQQFKLPDGSWQLGKSGNPKKTFWQRRPDGKGGHIAGLGDVRHTLYHRPQLEIGIAEGKTVHLCYSPDTEVLTPGGWVAFPELVPGTPVAQYDLSDESVNFCVPREHQRFRYSGELVNIKAQWCDLMVTPDHRQPRRHPRNARGVPSAPRVTPASSIRSSHQLPTAGMKRDGDAVPLTAARLMVAWLADGVWEPRGDQVSWNLKKARKIERLRAAFVVLGIRWTEHFYPSTSGWTNLRVMKADIAQHFPVGPDKRWPWAMLGWSADARGAALDELQYWDGDGQSDTSSRFFTGERQSADVVCALASITGYHANLRVDRRPGKNDSYVVNLSHKTWRQISRTPSRVRYDGEVFCCTVNTGLLIVRRNGKVMVSGNCEGEKDVETLEAWGMVATTNSGGAQNWRPEFAEFLRGADVVILGDDDEPGRKRVETVALSLRGIAGRIRAIGSWGGPKDVTDWKEAGHAASELVEILNTLPDWRPAPPASIMGAVGLDQLHHPSLKHEFLIDGFLDRQGVAMMPGASGSGKTFLVLEMAMCIATGRPFWGMGVKPGLVLYQAGEGKQGVTKRLDGWLMDRGLPPEGSTPFKMLTRRINLFADDKDTEDYIAEGKMWSTYYGLPVRMAVVDTFNKAITGANEIAGQDMTKVIARLERISVELDCAVVVPIHKSAEGKMRGHGSLKGDTANVVEVNELNIRDHNNRIIRTFGLDKNKDGEKGKPLRFVLRQVVLGDDERGNPVTTCVVDKPDGDEEEYGRQGKLSLNQIIALKALRQAAEDHGEPAPNGIRAGSAVRTVVKNAHWKESFGKIFPSFNAPASEPDKREAEAVRLLQHAGKVLLAGDYIGVDNSLGITWLTGKDDRPRPQSKPVEKPQPSPLMTPADMEVPF